MDWDSLISKLYGLRRFGIEPGLTTMQEALRRENSPQEGYRVITVAGTNGKGTVASMTAALLQAKGKSVGLYTSPHLIDVTERFRVNGEPLARDVVAPVMSRLLREYGRRQKRSGAVEGLTFFELTTLTAAVLFANCDVDVAVFEVGLGGRLDAVNAIEPDVTAVTTIARDHEEYLGTKLGAIAGEKAGIFRPGVPAVIGGQENDEAYRVLVTAAQKLGSPVVDTDDGSDDKADGAPFERRHRGTAVAVAEAALGAELPQSVMEEGFRRWRWPGRFEELQLEEDGRVLLVDAAHNPAGLRALKGAWIARRDEIGAVIWASMNDKDVSGIREFLEAINAPVWGSLVANDRALGTDELREVVPSKLWRGAMAIEEALAEVKRDTSGAILVFGSIYLLGEVMEAIGLSSSQLRTYVLH